MLMRIVSKPESVPVTTDGDELLNGLRVDHQFTWTESQLCHLTYIVAMASPRYARCIDRSNMDRACGGCNVSDRPIVIH